MPCIAKTQDERSDKMKRTPGRYSTGSYRLPYYTSQDHAQDDTSHGHTETITAKKQTRRTTQQGILEHILIKARFSGQRSQDSPHLLQGQRLQEAHPAQGYPVQGWQGTDGVSMIRKNRNSSSVLQASLFAQGKRRYDRKQSGYGGQTKPV
jgi:hypothetical protein